MPVRSFLLFALAALIGACSDEAAAPSTPDVTERPDGLLSVGTVAPELGLTDQAGRTHRLGDMRGKKVVLYFYPRDATPGCTVEAQGFRDVYDRIEQAGAIVLGVSTDDAASHAEFAADEGLPFPLLADTEQRVADAYGVEVTFGFVSRVTFLINASGRIARVFPDVDPDAHAEEVLSALSEI